ncbi:hypothetical protein ABZP36_015373 [Zizania latifolia]
MRCSHIRSPPPGADPAASPGCGGADLQIELETGLHHHLLAGGFTVNAFDALEHARVHLSCRMWRYYR